MRRLREHPFLMTAVAFGLAALAAVGIAAGYGFRSFAAAWSSLHWPWLALAIAAGPLAHLAYGAAYHAVAEADGAPDLRFRLVLRLVAAGFGPFTVRGGFALDRRALHALHEDRRSALQRMLGLGSLEWVLLAPAACAGAIGLLAVADPRPLRSMLWPWAIAVPVGFAIGLTAALAGNRERLTGHGGVRAAVARGLESLDILVLLSRRAGSAMAAFGGMAGYWALDVASFYGAVRFIGLPANVGEVIVAYATGYALTRRSMPLGGAGVTETFMTFSLHWMGQPVPAALAAVLIYRAVNFLLPTVPALLVRPSVMPLVRASEAGRPLTAAERRRAAAPLRLRLARN